MVDSACYRNEYQEYFFRGKGGRCVRLTYQLYVPIVMISESLELSGPVQAFTGITLNSTMGQALKV
jgi:hypothetical protein